jgi:Putative phage tail protein
MSGGGNGPPLFSNAFKGQNEKSLKYNAAQKGSPIAVVYGTQRVPVNVIAGFGFETSGSSGKAGGKGGGKSSKKGGVQYSVNGAFALCQGPVAFTGSPYADDGVNRVWANGGVADAEDVALNYYTGEDGQAPDPVFESSSELVPILGYSGTAYATGTPLHLGSAPVLPNIQVEVTGFGSNTAGIDFPGEVRPDWIVIDMLCNSRYGVGVPIGDLDTAGAWGAGGTIEDWGRYCQALGIAMSVLMDRQQPAARWVEEIIEQSNAAIFETGGQIKIVPYGETALSGNGVAWYPALTPRYYLDDNDFLGWGGDSDPVLVSRNDPAQIANWINAEYENAEGEFNKEVIPVFDQSAIDAYGLNVEASYMTSCITNTTSAQWSAQLRLDRGLQVRDTYQFKLGWRHALLEPMDVVALSDARLGLSSLPVRITEIAEDENGELAVTAEELGSTEAAVRGTVGRDGLPRSGQPPLYDRGIRSGTPLYDPLALPGDANEPIIFEPPVELTSGINEAWIVATGGINWGGCRVWISTDNTTYAHAATLHSGGRTGSLTATLPSASDPDPANTLAVDLFECNGELLSATRADADNYVTLCYVGGELLSYETATLTAPSAYDLTYLRRGAYGTPIGAHGAGARFARVGPNDNASIWRYRYPTNFIGQSVYVKLQSFNTFGNKLQDLAELSPHTYTLSGAGSTTGWIRVADSITAAVDLDFEHDRYYSAGSVGSLPGIITVSRASSGYAEFNSGHWASFAANTARRTDKGLLVEGVRTNWIQNNAMIGAVGGTPGTDPNRWVVEMTAPVAKTIIATGTTLGIDYIDYRFAGTAPAPGYFAFYYDSANLSTPAEAGQAWVLSWFDAIIAGSFAGVGTARLQQFDSGGGLLVNTDAAVPIPTGSLVRRTSAGTLTAPTTAFVRALIFYSYAAGPIDVTLRIGWPQLEQAAFASSPIRTTNAVATRAADIVTLIAPPGIGSEYTIFGKATPAAPSSYGAQRIAAIHGAASDSWSAGRELGNAVAVLSAGGTSATLTGGAMLGAGAQIAAAYRIADQALVLNGGAAATGASALAPAGLNTVAIGHGAAGAAPWGGYIERVAIWPGTRVSDAGLHALTEP